MKSLSANLVQEKNKQHSTYPWLLLLDITLPDSTIFRFVNNNEDIVYKGNTYTCFPFEIGPQESSVDGEIPKIELKICNITRILTPYLNTYNGGLESEVLITVVNSNLLAEDYSELEATLTVIDCQVDEYWVSWSLGLFNPTMQRFPLYRYLANYCSYPFFNTGIGECGYNGALTTCLHTLADCIAHGNEINFGGNLGLQNDGIRVV